MEVQTTSAPKTFPHGIPPGGLQRRMPGDEEGAAGVGRLEVPIDELRFFHLKTEAEIARIRHLREEIQLPASALADPSFSTREKKETNTG